MFYTLMHKELPVAELDIDEATGNILKVAEVFAPPHFPFSTVDRHGVVDRAALNQWWLSRSIPASRSGIRAALEFLNLADTTLLLTRCFGLSLSDQYWVKPKGMDLEWEKINFFENPFSEDIGDILMGRAKETDGINMVSPDNTSDGYLKKRWKIIDGKRCLLKAGSNPFQQQPFNEVIASATAERLGIPHVKYWIAWIDGMPYSVCEDFITPETELVSAWRVMQRVKKDNRDSVYRHYMKTCTALGIDTITAAVDQMIVLDYLIANEDRHQNNFGLVRNARTLEWIGPAPLFDSGSSLGFDKLPNQIRQSVNIACKPFKRTHEEQLKLVTDFSWIDFHTLDGLEDEIRVILDGAGDGIDEVRKQAISESVSRRIEHLYGLAMAQRHTEDDIHADISQDEAMDYSPRMGI